MKAKIKSVSNTGLLTVTFTQSIIVPENYSMFNQSVLKIEVKPSPDSQVENAGDLSIYNWKIVSLKSTVMKIQLNFTNPNKISDVVSGNQYFYFFFRPRIQLVSSFL